MAIVKDATWFHEYHRLRNFGKDVLGLCKKETPKLKIDEVFGPMSSKSGWKFKNYTTPAVATQIVELYKNVYDVDDVTNNEIPQKFVRALIVESDPERKVNWAKFAEYSRENREKVAETKAANLEVKAESGALLKVRLLQIGKRCIFFDRKENILTGVKQENGVMGFRGKLACKAVRLPNWEEKELSAMDSVLDCNRSSLKLLTSTLEESLSKKCEVEGEFRRSRLEFADHQVMHAQESLRYTSKQAQDALRLL
jgi:hypothetical protein